MKLWFRNIFVFPWLYIVEKHFYTYKETERHILKPKHGKGKYLHRHELSKRNRKKKSDPEKFINAHSIRSLHCTCILKRMKFKEMKIRSKWPTPLKISFDLEEMKEKHFLFKAGSYFGLLLKRGIHVLKKNIGLEL